MTLADIERLIRRLERSDITELEISDAATSLVLRLAPRRAEPNPRSQVPAEARAAAPDGPAPVLRAAAPGILRLRHPEAAPEAAPVFPRAVVSGEIVAFLEAGGCLRPVVADKDATLGAPLAAEGSLVGYGTPLFPLL